jgi:hypothetical protein
MNSPNDNDKKKDVASEAKTSGSENKTDESATQKETLNKIISKAGVLAEKGFTLGKAATKDVIEELKQANQIRKDTVATATEGTKKKDLAKAFWTKISTKQRGIILALSVLIAFVAYSVLFKNDNPKPVQATTTTGNQTISLVVNKSNCLKISDISKNMIQATATQFGVSYQSVRFLNATWGNDLFNKGQCTITVDTGKGPKKCEIGEVKDLFGGGIFSNGQTTWAHNGSGMNPCER